MQILLPKLNRIFSRSSWSARFLVILTCGWRLCCASWRPKRRISWSRGRSASCCCACRIWVRRKIGFWVFCWFLLLIPGILRRACWDIFFRASDASGYTPTCPLDMMPFALCFACRIFNVKFVSTSFNQIFKNFSVNLLFKIHLQINPL